MVKKKAKKPFVVVDCVPPDEKAAEALKVFVNLIEEKYRDAEDFEAALDSGTVDLGGDIIIDECRRLTDEEAKEIDKRTKLKN